MKMKMKLKLLLVLLLLPLSGCGIIAIGYNYADAYLRYSINSYTSFDAAQKEVVAREVEAYMRWHRKTMLPEYVGFLQTLQATAQSGAALEKGDVSRYRARLRALYVETLRPVVRPAASLLRGISAAQIEELVESFAKENNKRRSKELSGNAGEQLRKRAERTIDFMETLVGGFSDSQLEQIRAMSAKLPFATAIYIRQREDNQARLLELLRQGKSEEEIAAFLTEWLKAPEAGRNPEEQAVMLAFEQASDEMIATVYRTLSERQRKTLLKNIGKYIDTFQEMARKG